MDPRSRARLRTLLLMGIAAVGGGVNTDPAQAAEDWATGLATKTDKITRGVRAVTVSPGQQAARQKNVYLAQVQANVDKWAANSAAVTVGEWQDAMINKGVGRIAAGATASKGKMAAFFAQLLPAIDAAKSGLPARGNFEQNMARLQQYLTKMHGFSYRRG